MHPKEAKIYLGLMSGTSMDGIDAALVRFPAQGMELIATYSHPWPASLQHDLQRLTTPGDNEIDQLGELDILAANEFATAAKAVLAIANLPASAIAAIGSHGQTIRHRPDVQHAFTLQIGDPNRIAELTGITTVANFRRRDMAAGGEGAPLAPALHHALFGSKEAYRCILNIGGIANITLLPPQGRTAVSGFDTGPGNCLLDSWATHHIHAPFDESGEWGATGKVHPILLEQMLADSYFSRPAPKSTGREYFSLAWLEKLAEQHPELAPVDIQATLVALTARSIGNAIKATASDCQQLLVCGGGIHNPVLMKQLQQELAHCQIESTRHYGADPDWVEAIAFAWLARQTMRGLSGNLPSVTGASHSVILGGIYQGSLTTNC